MAKFTRACPHCDKTIEYLYLSGYKAAEARGAGCKSCRTRKNNQNRVHIKGENANWKGYKEVGSAWFSRYYTRNDKNRKRKAGDITIVDAYNQLEKQGFVCALTGIPLAWSEDSGMSIDRIDSNIGYYKDNIQMVHKDVNIMKNKYDQDYFINVCKMIAERFK